MQVCSFDIFDTVVTRRLSSPTDVFILLGESLAVEGIRVPPPRLFRHLRIRSERWARRLDSNQEVLISDIYKLLGLLLLWSSQQRKRAIELEMQIEFDILQATSYGLAEVRKARSDKKKIVFVSDMYLEGSFLRQLLMREGLAMSEDLVVVSGEWKASKSKQTIWPILLDKLSLMPDNLFHQGDNLESDVKSPSIFGINSRRLGTSDMSRWEEWRPQTSPLEVRDWGGIAALCRISRGQHPDPDEYWKQLGAGVIGPMLSGFVCWLYERAQAAGITTLWFLSRDGWLLHQAAEIYGRPEGIDLKYIGVSRNFLRSAHQGARPLNELFSGSRNVTWALVQDRLYFSSADMNQLQKCMNLEHMPKDRTIPLDIQNDILECLTKSEWASLRTTRASEAGNKVRSYLDQLANNSGSIGLVDIGWAGSSQSMLESICPAVCHGYYLGLCNSKVENSKSAWLYDLSMQKGCTQLNSFQRMIEALIGCDCGPLVGYIKANEVWTPQFSLDYRHESTPGRQEMQKVALDFVKLSVHPEYSKWYTNDNLRVFASRNLINLLETPDARDIMSFSQWRITTDDAHQDTVMPVQGFDFYRLARCLTKKEAWGLIWPQAAFANTSQPMSVFLKLLFIVRSLVS